MERVILVSSFTLRKMGHFIGLRVFFELINMDPFAARFVISGDATPDGIRVVRSVLGAISSLPIVALNLRQANSEPLHQRCWQRRTWRESFQSSEAERVILQKPRESSRSPQVEPLSSFVKWILNRVLHHSHVDRLGVRLLLS